MTGRKPLFDAYRERPYRNIFVALIAVLLIDALAPNAFARGRFSDLMMAVILFAALVETISSRRHVIWAVVLGVPAIGLRLMGAFTVDSMPGNVTILTGTAVFLAFLIWNLLHNLNRSDRPTSERIFGALCAYIFIGMLFALLYTHIAYRDPDAFAISNEAMMQAATSEASLMPVFTYYSFVTLTTLGYGDITPVAEHVRTLAWLEALIGQLYLAVMVAGFVATHISERMRKNRGDPPPDGSDGSPS